MEPRTINVKFSVSGYAEQSILLNPDVNMTAEEIRGGLESGELFTSIQEHGGTLFRLADDTELGQVVNVDNYCEYTDFEVEDDN